jgi:catechol 2,3-dioxygenase-like lactoylglutathione lyase family enzyme
LEVNMGTTQTSKESNRTTPAMQQPVDTRLEVVVVPVSDVERAKKFYTGLGWRMDGDFAAGDAWRVVQLTPPGSACSIFVGKGLTTTKPGSLQGLLLIVDDIEAARTDLVAKGVDVSEVFHFDGPLHFDSKEGRAAGPDPTGQSYRTFVSFDDPDGNSWTLQEIKQRLPGRGYGNDVATLTELLKEAEKHHGPYEAKAPKHHWSGFYAAYIAARQNGRTPDEADKEARLHMDRALH